jgi:hypothetical protein
VWLHAQQLIARTLGWVHTQQLLARRTLGWLHAQQLLASTQASRWSELLQGGCMHISC